MARKFFCEWILESFCCSSLSEDSELLEGNGLGGGTLKDQALLE